MQSLNVELKRLVEISSLSRNGTSEVVNHLAQLMEDVGLHVEPQHVMHSLEGVSKRQFNVVGVLGEPLVDEMTKTGLLLQSHLDTGLDPKQIKLNNDDAGAVYGAGVSDSKGDFLAKLFAVKRFREKKLKMPIYLVGTCGAELGQFGARYLIQSKILNPQYVMVGYPTDLRMGVEQRSLLNFDISIVYRVTERDPRGFNRGVKINIKSSMGSAFEGSNKPDALTVALALIKDSVQAGFDLRIKFINSNSDMLSLSTDCFLELYLTSHQFEDFKRLLKQEEFTKKYNGLVSLDYEFLIVGDAGVSFIPHDGTLAMYRLFDELKLRLNEDVENSVSNFYYINQEINSTRFGLAVAYSSALSDKIVCTALADAIARISNQFPAMNINIQKTISIPGLESNDSEIKLILKESIEKESVSCEELKTSGINESGIFSRAGFDTVFFGAGGMDSNPRSDKENISIEQLDRSVEIYSKIIERVCM